MRGLTAIAIAAALCLSNGTGCRGVDPGSDRGQSSAEKARPAPAASSQGDGETGGAGVLRGRVLFAGPRPERQKALVVKDVAVCSKIDHLDDRLIVGEDGGIQNAVVSIVGVKGGKPLSSMGDEFILDQKSCAYSPHVVLIPAGGTLKVINEDGVLHNIHTYSKLNPPCNLAQPKVLREITRRFDIPEKIPVRCDVHGWMSSWVIVVDQPYNAVTDEHGRFELTDVPPGTYSVECWQEKLGVQTAEITIGPAPAEHEFSFSPAAAQ